MHDGTAGFKMVESLYSDWLYFLWHGIKNSIHCLAGASGSLYH